MNYYQSMAAFFNTYPILLYPLGAGFLNILCLNLINSTTAAAAIITIPAITQLRALIMLRLKHLILIHIWLMFTLSLIHI